MKMGPRCPTSLYTWLCHCLLVTINSISDCWPVAADHSSSGLLRPPPLHINRTSTDSLRSSRLFHLQYDKICRSQLIQWWSRSQSETIPTKSSRGECMAQFCAGASQWILFSIVIFEYKSTLASCIAVINSSCMVQQYLHLPTIWGSLLFTI
jgi:hypothetical protein